MGKLISNVIISCVWICDVGKITEYNNKDWKWNPEKRKDIQQRNFNEKYRQNG